jgi:hypothetical protein
MMAQETRLLVHLEEYSKQLARHLATLQECHSSLEVVWSRLGEIYEGEGAEMFTQAFGVASDRLRDYTVDGSEISRMLERKIEDLRLFTSSNTEL